jgi:hypothetical protein
MPVLKDPKTGKTIFVMEEEDEEEEKTPQIPRGIKRILNKLPEITIPEEELKGIKSGQEEAKPVVQQMPVVQQVPVIQQLPVIPRKPKKTDAYWSTHRFHRRSVEVALDEYPYQSWEQIVDLCERAKSLGKDQPTLARGVGWLNKGERDAAIIATLFLGGFRRQEICHRVYKMPDGSNYEIGIKKGDFRFVTMPDGRDFIEFRNIKILKKYRKIPGTEYFDEFGKRHWKTQRVRGTRTFVLPAKEPVVGYLVNWARHFRYGQFLFDFTPRVIYDVCTMLDKRLFPHLLRSWRATQLAVEYHYDLAQLLAFFEWEDLKYARLYAKMNVTKMAMMTPDIEYDVGNHVVQKDKEGEEQQPQQ